jgi:DNA polymerase elongation subunit (family B)
MTFEVTGRHLMDLWLLKQSRDGSSSQLTKSTTVPGDHGISALWEKASAEVKERALEAVRVVCATAAELSGEIFHLTQMLPYNFGTVARLGAAAKVDALMLREYLRLRHSIPKPESGVPPTGVSSELYYTGVFNTIVQIELEALYPRLLLAQEVHPSTDHLHVFQSILRQLETCKLESTRPEESNAYQLLVDSLYPYLHHRRNIFSDQERGSELAADARELLTRAVREVELHNGIVIQTEETTLFCQPPDNVSGEKAELAFVGHAGAQLPEEVHLVLRNRYRRMASYRKRNYSLLDYNERMTIHGAALNPHTIERFGRSYLQMGIDCILRLDFENLHKLYVELQQSIRERQLDIADIVRTEILHDALEVYRQEVVEEKRNHAPAFEAALRSSRSFSPGDKISYYISSHGTHQREAEAAREAGEWDPNFPDEDTAYYLRRLEDFSRRFEVFFAEKDFKRIFSSDDLFGFEGEPIIPITQKETADSSSAAADSKIMLDL